MRTLVAVAEPARWCSRCFKPYPDLAHLVFEGVASAMGERLRRALNDHLDEHGCGTGDHRSPRYVGGFWHCPEAKALWDLLPEWDKVALA